MRLAELYVYPVKGARGIALDRARVRADGLQHDRRFMLVDAAGCFLSQREHPSLAVIRTELREASLVIATPAGEAVEVPLAPAGPRRLVHIWRNDVVAVEVEGPASALVSDHLGAACSLVFMPDDVVRPVNPAYALPGDRVSFADGYPVLLAASSSLDDLNARLAEAVPMNRFRPNLVVDGGVAFEEELHARVRVGGVTFRMPKRCDRCTVITVDQSTGAVGREPLRTLATYRSDANKVYFAQNLIPEASLGAGGARVAGELALGDEVAYLERLAPYSEPRRQA